MPNDIRNILELRKTLRRSADELSNSSEFKGKTENTENVEKVRHLIDATLDATDERSFFLDVISIKSFLKSIKKNCS
jgi:hypothetical protein